MASDSLQTGNYIDRINIKKIWDVDGVYVGIAGNPGYAKKFIDWYRGDQKEYPQLGEQFAALVLYPDGFCEYWDDIGVGQPCGVPAAIGSGGEMAMGALMAGATPEEAIKVAIKLDEKTGGEIQTLGKMKRGKTI